MKHLTLVALLCFYSFASLPYLNAQEKIDLTHFTPEDIINIEYLGSVAIAPNNNMVVWTKRKGVKKKDKFVSNLYLTRLDLPEKDGFKTIQLTHGVEDDSSPLFSKDGEFIYFLSSREKGKKLWKLSIYGGEAVAIDSFTNGISNMKWKDAHTLLFQSNDGKTLYEQLAEEKKDNVVVIEDTLQWKPNHIYTFDLKNKTSKRLTNNAKPLTGYSISKDGKWLIYGVQRNISYAADAQLDPYQYLKNLETGETTQILFEFEYPTYGFEFTNDHNGFYFSSTKGSNPKYNSPGIDELYYFDLKTKNYTKVNLDWDLGLNDGYHVVDDGILVSLANKAKRRIVFYKKKNNTWTKQDIDLVDKNDHVSVNTVSEDGTKIVYNHSTASKLPTYYIADIKNFKFNNEATLVKLNTNLSKKSITKSEVMVWEGYNSDEVTGILYYPVNYEKGKRYPLMLSIHGGPSSVDLDQWRESWATYPNILAQRGMFVLKPNYHGSSNHGLEFVESIRENYYEPELEDIMKGISVLDKAGKIDMNQLGTMGWSNGAILTTMLTVKYPEMFKVAAAGAGDVNWTSDYGTCQFGVSFDQHYFGGAPWDDMNGKIYNENFILKSPLFEIEKIKTPTIIFHGSEDRAVPRDQGWEYYRGLQQVGQAPVRFLWFPDQPHGLGKITHQLRKMEEELQWIDTYLFEKSNENNLAFKKESPLAQKIELDKAAITDGLYGEINKNVLIPETVITKKDSIAIGRFEVTNAQFKAFDNSFNYKVGTENYPAVVSKEQANNYVSWLCNHTNNTYRLPNKKEAEALHKLSGKVASKENTLNYWAGYKLVPSDAAKLKTKLAELKSTLLKPVGSYQSSKVNDAEIYDLGGNVAEYFSEGIYGYSAYDYYDANNDAMLQSSHVGFRVVEEPASAKK